MIMTMATTKKTRIITVVNHKGGVGKTMTAANLGAALAKMGKTVLLVDADGQCNLTMQSVEVDADGQCNLTMQSVEEVTVPTLSDYLNNDDIEVNPQQVSKKLFLIPGSTALDADSHNIELSIEEDAGATKYMSEWLEKVKGEYDYVIIDSAPGSGAMLVNVIVAADELIIPIADKFSIPGAKKLTQIIRANNKEVRGHYLLTKQTKWGVSKQIKELLLTQAPENLYHTAIRQCEELNKAAACGMSIFDYNPKCNGAEDYMALAKEINKGTKDKDMPF